MQQEIPEEKDGGVNKKNPGIYEIPGKRLCQIINQIIAVRS